MKKSFLDRFNEKWIPEPNSGCWLWIGCWSRGYGQIGNNDKVVSAHRTAYELFRGQIPKDLTIDHLCRTRSCVNPSHMEIVSRGENVLRGNGIAAKNARKTHCPKGHPLSGENLRFRKTGGYGRRCRKCGAERQRLYRKTHNL